MSVHLNELEAAALAYRIVGLKVKDTESWLEWEDYPELDEESFRQVDEQARKIGQSTLERSRELDTLAGLDSAEIAERAS